MYTLESYMFEGQVRSAFYTLEQIECLTSAIRGDIYSQFSDRTPMSVAEAAKAVGKSAQTVHYHVNELLDVNLIMPAGTRKSWARTETVYVRSAINSVIDESRRDEAYVDAVIRRFKALARSLAREREAFHKAWLKNSSARELSLVRWEVLRLSDTGITEAKKLITELRDTVREHQLSEGGHRVRFMTYLSPTVSESKEIVKRASKK